MNQNTNGTVTRSKLIAFYKTLLFLNLIYEFVLFLQEIHILNG